MPNRSLKLPTFSFGVYLSNGDGTFQIVYPTLPPSANSIFDIQYDLKYDDGAYVIPGDFNGDGKTDFIRQEHGAWDDDTGSRGRRGGPAASICSIRAWRWRQRRCDWCAGSSGTPAP